MSRRMVAGETRKYIEQILHGREGPLLQQIEDQALALGFLHRVLPIMSGDDHHR